MANEAIDAVPVSLREAREMSLNDLLRRIGWRSEKSATRPSAKDLYDRLGVLMGSFTAHEVLDLLLACGEVVDAKHFDLEYRSKADSMGRRQFALRWHDGERDRGQIYYADPREVVARLQKNGHSVSVRSRIARGIKQERSK